MLTPLAHRALILACRREDRAFRQNSFQLEKVQREKLSVLLRSVGQSSSLSWEAFREAFPATRYGEWHERISAQRNGGEPISQSPLVRYQPTSGSSERLKLIPYTQLFLKELDSAIAPWLSSLYRQHPSLRDGTHYWSVSWLPKSQQEAMKGNLNDDSELLGFVKRLLANLTQAVPSNVALANQADDAMFATLCFLVARKNLRMLSVWSPTFALQQLEALRHFGQEISTVLATGSWGGRSVSLPGLSAPHEPSRAAVLSEALKLDVPEMTQYLWPGLSLVSAWDTADAAGWAQDLRAQFPHVAFEGKGLWATEGVVTIPYDGHYPLAYRSHVYEFEEIATEKVLAPWELREGDEVSPIISAGNGLLRYRLDDHLVVSGFWNGLPCFRFKGRRFGVDLVGEKMSPETARRVLDEVGRASNLEPVTLLALDSRGAGRPRYVGVFSSGKNAEPAVDWSAGALLEKALASHFHYELARDLKQLAPAGVMVMADGWKDFQQIAVAGGMIEGNIKPEPVKRIARDALLKVHPQLLQSLEAADEQRMGPSAAKET